MAGPDARMNPARYTAALIARDPWVEQLIRGYQSIARATVGGRAYKVLIGEPAVFGTEGFYTLIADEDVIRHPDGWVIDGHVMMRMNARTGACVWMTKEPYRRPKRRVGYLVNGRLCPGDSLEEAQVYFAKLVARRIIGDEPIEIPF